MIDTVPAAVQQLMAILGAFPDLYTEEEIASSGKVTLEVDGDGLILRSAESTDKTRVLFCVKDTDVYSLTLVSPFHQPTFYIEVLSNGLSVTQNNVRGTCNFRLIKCGRRSWVMTQYENGIRGVISCINVYNPEGTTQFKLERTDLLVEGIAHVIPINARQIVRMALVLAVLDRLAGQDDLLQVALQDYVAVVNEDCGLLIFKSCTVPQIEVLFRKVNRDDYKVSISRTGAEGITYQIRAPTDDIMTIKNLDDLSEFTVDWADVVNCHFQHRGARYRAAVPNIAGTHANIYVTKL